MIDTAALDIGYGTEYAKLSVSDNDSECGYRYSSLADIREAVDATIDLIDREVIKLYGQELADKYVHVASDNASMYCGKEIYDAQKAYLDGAYEQQAVHLLDLIKAEAAWSDMYAASLHASIQDELDGK
jgi:hypothetical protein